MKPGYYRNFHLSYCLVCINRNFDINKGLICNLSNEIADFKENCSYFLVDSLQKEKLQKQVDFNIDYEYNTKLSEEFNDFIGNSYFKESEKFGIYTITYQTYKIYKSNFNDHYFLISTLFIGLIYNLIKSLYNDLNLKISMILLLVIVPYIIFISKKVIKKLEIDKDGITIKENKIFWNEIYRFGIYIMPGKSTQFELMLFTLTRGLITVNLNEYNANHKEIIQIIKKNLN
jgi:hypothetical protein